MHVPKKRAVNSRRGIRQVLGLMRKATALTPTSVTVLRQDCLLSVHLYTTVQLGKASAAGTHRRAGDRTGALGVRKLTPAAFLIALPDPSAAGFLTFR